MSARNVVNAVIEEIHSVGPRVLVYVDLGTRLVVEITPNSLKELDLRGGPAGLPDYQDQQHRGA